MVDFCVDVGREPLISTHPPPVPTILNVLNPFCNLSMHTIGQNKIINVYK